MTPDERSLLLTVARTMRAKIRDEIYAEQAGDLEALNEALAPFDPDPQHGGDFESPAHTEPMAKSALHDRLAEAIDPSAAPDGYGDLMLCRIHAEIQNSHPEVTVEHRNIVLHAVAEAIRHPPTERAGHE